MAVTGVKCIFVGGLALGWVAAFGSGGSYPAPVLDAEPTIDGDLGEAAWKNALHLDGFADQATGGPTADRSEAWVGVTDSGIWVAIYCHDSQPDKIVARTIQKGGQLEDDDFCGLIIDPMNRRTFNGNSQFFVNAIGTQYENIAGGRAAKKEWRGSWRSATKRVDDGYIVEMMVPWRVLQFPAGKKSDLLFNVGRVQQRTKAVSYALDVGRPMLAENHGTLLQVPFPAAAAADQIDLLGYISPEYDSDSSPTTSFHAGLDIRYRPTQTLTSVLSLSPDFKNIESEVEGIGFTRTERFLSDVRPFFAEGSQYFNLTSGYGIGRIFYSNRIDNFDQGVKFFGDFGARSSVSFLAAREDGNRLDSVARYQYQFGTRSNASMFATYRDEPGRKSSVIGAKTNVALGSHSVGMELMQSDDAGNRGVAGYGYLDFTYPNYFLTFSGSFIQPDFRARLGYVPQVDRRGGFMYQEYNREYRNGPVRKVSLHAYADDFKHFDGSNETRSMSMNGSFETPSDWEFSGGYNREVFENEVREIYSAGAGWNVSNRFRQISVFYNWGDQDGRYTDFLSVEGKFRLAPGLDLGVETSAFKLGGRRDQSVVTLGWEMDSEQSLTGRFVRTDGDSNWYLAYRKSGGLGLEYFFIFGDPNAREFRNRAAFKVVWAR